MDDSSEEPRSRPLSFLGAAGWTLIVLSLLQLSLAITESAHPGAVTDLVSIATCTVLAHSIVIFAILRLHEPNGSIRAVLALKPASPAFFALAAAVGAGLAPGAIRLNALLQEKYPPSPEDAEKLEKIFATNTLGHRVAVFVVLVLVLPACTEFLFRGALFTLLKRGRRTDIVIVATSAYHALMGTVTAPGMASTLALALTLGWMRALTGSVLPSLLCSMVFFGVEVVPYALGHDEVHWRVPMIAGGLGLAAIALVAMAALGRRSAPSFED
ncbi:hypothetical protein AKJ09_08735 [Labilithrix luteola]|uniref:CAAX prenyl protease 2/Lysostaphin resistance protein A-like domain-containing protein n=1 Tax=Labilithrix luteola TaxID=1391654 RepID=A0A0K1Q8S1_9BACT|nr:CPBP family intramembrane glutamic endopeptidase [Labilithrix luteola]AKV02072.1 hypothetical protein AKJ09_08735 [Labilithrix luteola]